VPTAAGIGSSTSLFLRMVFGDRPGRPCASQSSAACRTVWFEGAGRGAGVQLAVQLRQPVGDYRLGLAGHLAADPLPSGPNPG
jgi:hypothetical protein